MGEVFPEKGLCQDKAVFFGTGMTHFSVPGCLPVPHLFLQTLVLLAVDQGIDCLLSFPLKAQSVFLEKFVQPGMRFQSLFSYQLPFLRPVQSFHFVTSTPLRHAGKITHAILPFACLSGGEITILPDTMQQNCDPDLPVERQITSLSAPATGSAMGLFYAPLFPTGHEGIDKAFRRLGSPV